MQRSSNIGQEEITQLQCETSELFKRQQLFEFLIYKHKKENVLFGVICLDVLYLYSFCYYLSASQKFLILFMWLCYFSKAFLITIQHCSLIHTADRDVSPLLLAVALH